MIISDFIGVFLAVLLASTLGTFLAYHIVKIMVRRDFGIDFKELKEILKQLKKKAMKCPR